jgi:hypothetical protein
LVQVHGRPAIGDGHTWPGFFVGQKEGSPPEKLTGYGLVLSNKIRKIIQHLVVVNG